jgi:hypothetical protein
VGENLVGFRFLPIAKVRVFWWKEWNCGTDHLRSTCMAHEPAIAFAAIGRDGPANAQGCK